MSPRAPYQRCIVALVCAVLGICGSARAQSALDGFDPGADNSVKTLLVQPDGKILVGGDFTMLGGGGTGATARNRIGRLNADGSLDAGFNPGSNGTVATLALQPDGKILVGGNFTGLGGGTGATTRNNIGRLNSDGSVDPSFNPGTTGYTGVYGMIVQPDGKILVCGVFTGIGGGTGTTPRSSLARLNSDGSVDNTFNPGVVGRPGYYVAQIYGMALQADGKIVVGGRFKGLGGGTGATPRENIGRLNPDGSVDAGFDPGVNNFVFSLAVQPDGKILVAGSFFTMGGGGEGLTTRQGIGRLNANGTLDNGFDPGTNNEAVWPLALQPDGKILIGGSFTGIGGGTGTTPRSKLGRINADGSIDLAFNPGANGTYNDYVLAFATQPDGKILVGGQFTGLGGGTGTTTRNRIGRLNADGSVEDDFNPGAAGNAIYALAIQPDQKILVGGDFTGLGGGTGTTLRSNLGRLNADGSLDTLFNPGASGVVSAIAVQPDGKIIVGGTFGILGSQEEYNLGRLNADGSADLTFAIWTNGQVNAIAIQPDGKILVGGLFSTVHDENGGPVDYPRNRIVRINANGSVDTSFDPGVAGVGVYTLAVQPDGKILVGGQFTGLGGGTGATPRSYMGRLNLDGTVDMLFNPGANSYVHAFSVQPDGKIVVGGIFNRLGGGTGTTVRNRIGRINADGTLDTLFDPGANINVYSTVLQADGKILVAGYFTALGGGTGTQTPRSKIGRINPDGSIDLAFDPGANNTIFAMALQGDGKMLFGGYFTTLGGGGIGTATRNRIGRVSNPDAALQSLTVAGSGSVVTWSRGGAAPDPARVTLEVSVDSTTYTTVGHATRVAGGWQLSGLSLPTRNMFIRARGYYGSGYSNGSGSIVESIRNAWLPCTFALSSSSASVPSGVNAGSVTLIAGDSSCPWTTANNAFITVTSDSAGMGTTLVRWVTAINPSTSPRTGTITIAGLTFTITQAGASTTRRVANDFNHDAISDIAVFRPSTGRWYIVGQPVTDWGAPGDMPVPGDYNGDGNPDIALFRPSNGTWYVNGGATVVWGMPGDIPVPGDYDGDHITDMAVFRPSAGQWLVRNVGTFTWGLAGDLPVPGDYNGDGVTDIGVYRPSTGTWYVRNVMTAVYGFAADVPVPADYNGDGTTDIAVFRPSSGTWFVKDQFTDTWGVAGDVPVPMDRSGDGIAELGVFRRATGTWYFRNRLADSSESAVWGGPGDIPLGRALPPVQTKWGDYDGDRKADLTVFRPSTGDWVSLRSLSGMTDYTLRTWGLSSDVPVGRDYDGDGKIDPTVFRPSTGRWFVLQSSTSYTSYVSQDWGLSSDTPVPADYDGDGKADFAVYRPSLGRWVILLSSSNNTMYAQYDWGVSTDIVVPADYDGDGVTDLAVFRPSTGRWYILNRMTGATTTRDWGLNGDMPVAADFDGDGKADIAVFRPSLGRWFITSSIDGSYQAIDWGLSGDYGVPADYDGDGKADVAVFRPSTGTWYVRGLFNRSWGLSGDIPALKNP